MTQAKPTRNNGSKPVTAEVIADLLARSKRGLETYGDVLHTHNGRDALLDAYEETLDLAQYLKQELMERADRPPSIGLLPDHEIAYLALEHGMIDPFLSGQVREHDDRPVLSYGLSSYGYDARLADEFRICEAGNKVIDPKAFDPDLFRSIVATGWLDIPPHGFVLARTVERFRIPRDVLAVCYAKSTYARCGLVVGVTPLEPEWEGTVTLELSNTTDRPIRVYVGEGICQFLFYRAGEACDVSYADRGGKYQGQSGVTMPRV